MLMVSSQCSGSSTVSLVRIKIIIVRITDRPPQWFEFVVGSLQFFPSPKNPAFPNLGNGKKKHSVDMLLRRVSPNS